MSASSSSLLYFLVVFESCSNAIAVLTFAQVGAEYYQEQQVRLFNLVVLLLSCPALFV